MIWDRDGHIMTLQLKYLRQRAHKTQQYWRPYNDLQHFRFRAPPISVWCPRKSMWCGPLNRTIEQVLQKVLSTNEGHYDKLQVSWCVIGRQVISNNHTDYSEAAQGPCCATFGVRTRYSLFVSERFVTLFPAYISSYIHNKVRWNHVSIPKLQRWSLGIDK